MRYLILDTESSLCAVRRRRVLASLACEVVDAEGGVLGAQYAIVRRPPGHRPDAPSVAVHGIGAGQAALRGQPVGRVLRGLFALVAAHEPLDAVVGHDVVGDVNLLISEALQAGLGCGTLPGALTHLLCTRMLSTHLCALPRPGWGPGFKWPSLEESYRLLVPRARARARHSAHDARGDVERCRALFRHLLDGGPQGSGGSNSQTVCSR